MWIVSLFDTETEEILDVLVGNNEEFQKLFDYVKMSPNLELYHVEERFVCPDVDPDILILKVYDP